MGFFLQKETLAMSGSANETIITLQRGNKQFIREIRVYFPNAAIGDYVQFFRKSSATTAAEQDASDTTSNQVLMGEGYFFNGDLLISDVMVSYYVRDAQLRTEKLIVRINSTQIGTAYLNIAYEYV